MMRHPAKPKESGLTLIEVLIALMIFAFIASIAVYSLRLGVGAREQLNETDARLAELQLARMLLKEDFAQVVARPARDEFGEPQGPTFLGGAETSRRPYVPGERLLVAFVRGGWANPEARAPRSNLQYVEYLEKDGALIRRSRPFVDAARGQEAMTRVLVHDVSDVVIEFAAGAGALEVRSNDSVVWTASWPSVGSAAPAPPAVALEFSTPRLGAVRQLFWIGTVGPERGDQ